MGIVEDYERMCSDIGKSLKGFLRSCPSDVSLLVEGQKLPAHKFLLSARSTYLDTLFSIKEGSQDVKKVSVQAEDVSREASQDIIELHDVYQSNLESLVEFEVTIVPLTDNVIEIKNVKLEVMKGVLVYFYEGHYDCHERVETHLLALELARLFILEGLEKILIDHLVKSFTLESFVNIFHPETPNRNIKLEKACFDFFKDNVEKMIVNDNFSKLTCFGCHLLQELAMNSNAMHAQIATIDKFNYFLHLVDTHLQALELARQFNLKSLEELLIDHLVESITMRNFNHFFNLHSRYENVKMEKACNDFLKENSEVIAASDNILKLTLDSLLYLLDAESFGADEIDIFRAAERWAGVNKPNVETVRDIVGKIRLETISQKDLFNVVKCSKELPSIDIIDVLQSIVDKDAASTNFRQQQQRKVTASNRILESEGATVTGGWYDPMYCIDGNEKSCAVVTEDSPLTITLGHPYWLSSLRVKINAGGTSYTIESSPDGESWQPVGGETKGKRSDVWRTYNFSRRVVLHFRITVKKMSLLFNWLNLYHFESPNSITAVTN